VTVDLRCPQIADLVAGLAPAIHQATTFMTTQMEARIKRAHDAAPGFCL
jgi:hypothetical protein